MDWNRPEDRAALIEAVGPKEYERQQKEHWEKSAVGVFNGYRIRPIVTQRFGALFQIDGLSIAYRHIEEAKAHAMAQKPGPLAMEGVAP